MTDPMYSAGQFLVDSPGGSIGMGGIKVETSMDALTTSTSASTASVPIPPRRQAQDIDFCFDLSTESFSAGSPYVSQDSSDVGLLPSGGGALWARDIKMDEDIFQVDKSDLIQDPTLAELNASEDTFLGSGCLDLNFDEILLQADCGYLTNPPTPSAALETYLLPDATNAMGLQMQPTSTSVTHLSVNTSMVASSFPPAGSNPGLAFLINKDAGAASSVPSSPFDVFTSPTTTQGASISPSIGQQVPPAALSPSSQHSSHSQHSSSGSLPHPGTSVSPFSTMRHSTLHELLLRKEPRVSTNRRIPSSPSRSGIGTFRSSTSVSSSSRLSSSAPTSDHHLGLEQIWQRREPRKHLLSTGSLAEAGSTSSLSTAGVLSPESHDYYSHDDEDDSDDDSDHLEVDENTSDDESSDGEQPQRIPRSNSASSGGGSSSKKERFFWQYNVQAKGPKGQRLVLKTKLEDPHVLNEVTDPVFSPQCAVRGIKHSGKARKGDGNDLTPNAKKLQTIGRELDKLSKVINDITPVAELPFNVRPKTRKEKNKLASRACRLKKKAQHEANKIKLYGLEHEHKKLLIGIQQMKQLLVAKFNVINEGQLNEEITRQSEKVVKSATKTKIANHTTEYVNRVLERVKSGVPDGGLNEF